MRYPTVGDYYFNPEGTLQFDIADTGILFYNMMILVHEIVEYALLEKRGVAIVEIDEFDIMFETERVESYHGIEDEPGFDTRCPYNREHTLATAVEMLMCAHAGINWIEYNETIITL